MRAPGVHLFHSPEKIVQRALLLASIHRKDLISAAGPDGLAAMVSLCRAGYERVECARQATCVGADEQSDFLLILGRMTASDLADVIRRTARLLRDGGVLIIQVTGAGDEAAIRPALAAAGLEAPFTLVDRSVGRLVMHRVKRAAGLVRKAS